MQLAVRAGVILVALFALGSPLGLSLARAASGPALAPLPKAPTLADTAPQRGDIEKLDALLAALTGSEATRREAGMREVAQATPRLVLAIGARLVAVAAESDREAMKRLLGDVRRRARDRAREQLRSLGSSEHLVTPDYLPMLLGYEQPESKTWRDLVSVVAMSRMLTEAGTVEAVRELIQIYVRFGEFLRVDTQLQLEKLGDKSLAALIEARRHKAEKIARWAERQLDALGKAVPGEAVQTTDPEVLADVLRAYGRTRDPDAARIVITFANSERAQVREAARQAVALLGEVAQWQLRDTYEDFVGQRAPRDWAWERTARELFDRFDRQRSAQVLKLFEQGQQAQQASRWEEMRAAFDRVLAQNPQFERRSEMAAGYLEYARKASAEKLDQRLLALRRVERIQASEELGKTAKSLRLSLESEALLAGGVADQTLLRRALELDPNNEHARELLRRVSRDEQDVPGAFYRYLAAGVIGLVALVGMLTIWFGLRRNRHDRGIAGAQPEQPPPAASAEQNHQPAPASAPALVDPDPSPSAEQNHQPAPASAPGDLSASLNRSPSSPGSVELEAPLPGTISEKIE